MHINSPLLKSYPLTEICGVDVWLKMDALQPSGSFKLRGMGLKAKLEVDRGAEKFVSSSGGNAGLAVAYAGLQLGVPVIVYVPGTTDVETVNRLKTYDAEVIVTGDHWAEAHAEAVKELDDENAAYFHPFDDPDVWQGHSSLIDEVVAEGLSPDLIVCSVGGGGLMCGVIAGIARHELVSTRILAVETRGADSLSQCRVQQDHITLGGIDSRAKSLGATRVCARAYDHLSNPNLFNLVVGDDDAAAACELFLRDHRVKVELACGAALSPVYQANHLVQNDLRSVLVVVCGGVCD